MFQNPCNIEDPIPEIPGLKYVTDFNSVELMIKAYSNGYFPWNNEDEPVMWYAPDPRFVLYPNELRLNKSNRKAIRENKLSFTFNTRFEDVLHLCQNIARKGQYGSWITEELFEILMVLNQKGIAQSVEAWQEEKLVGGFYGINLEMQKVFCGESMFSLIPGASKMAFIWFCQNIAINKYRIIDCQQETPHMKSLGAKHIPLSQFVTYLGL